MASQLDIYNGSLVKLAKAPTLTDAATAARQSTFGQALAAAWPIVMPEQLRRYKWNFASARAQVPADTSTPTFGWTGAFQMPADPPCYRVWDVNYCKGKPPVPFVVEGKLILCNEPAPLNVRYIAKIFDVTLFDAQFARVLTLELAAYCCVAITGSSDLAAGLQREAKRIVDEAQSMDSEEGEEEPDDSLGDWQSWRLTMGN